jgi:hypothetical protein
MHMMVGWKILNIEMLGMMNFKQFTKLRQQNLFGMELGINANGRHRRSICYKPQIL